MSTLFLFGAGASYGSLYTKPCCPPLGGGLFAALCKFSPLIHEHCEFEKDRFENFEEGMRWVYHERATFLPTFVCEMAKYFAQFKIEDGNVYVDFINSLKHRARHCCFATLNYELLLEQALVHNGFKVVYKYNDRQADEISVVKIHGSINFLPPKNWWHSFKGNSFENWSSLDVGGRIADLGHMIGRVSRPHRSPIWVGSGTADGVSGWRCGAR